MAPSDFGIRSRPPTCAVPWPWINLEGEDKAGKTYAMAEFTTDDRLGEVFWLDLGEGAGDEYAALPGTRWEVLEHDSTWSSIVGQVRAVRSYAREVAAKRDKPVVLAIDTMTREWGMLKDWANSRALMTDNAAAKLEENPDADISTDMRFWNDANARHRTLTDMLMTFPGIVISTARGKETAVVGGDGQPVRGRKVWKVDAQKDLVFDVTGTVRMLRSRPPLVTGLRSVHAGVRPGVDKPVPVPEFSLSWLIFDLMKCDPASAEVRDLKVSIESVLAQVAATQTLDELKGIYLESQGTHGDRIAVTRAVKYRKTAIQRIEAAEALTTRDDTAPQPATEQQASVA